MSHTISKNDLLAALEARYDHQSARAVLSMMLASPALDASRKKFELSAVDAALEPLVERGLATIRHRLRSHAGPARGPRASRSSRTRKREKAT